MKITRTTYPILTLIASNSIAIIGVLFFKWDLAAILAMFWTENLVVGFYSILKMILAKKGFYPGSGFADIINKLTIIPFFIIHYSIFMIVHGIILLIFISNINKVSTAVPFDTLKMIFPGFIALFISHGFSFVQNYLILGERNKYSAQTIMFQPYKRVGIMHFTLILGAFATFFLGQFIGFLLVLVILKTVIDIEAHLKERKKSSSIPDEDSEEDLGVNRKPLGTLGKIAFALLQLPVLVATYAILIFFCSVVALNIIPNLNKPIEIGDFPTSEKSKIQEIKTQEDKTKATFPVRWMNYKNSDSGYSYEYPSNWVNEEVPDTKIWDEEKMVETTIKTSILKSLENPYVYLAVTYGIDGGRCSHYETFKDTYKDLNTYESSQSGYNAVTVEGLTPWNTTSYEKAIYIPKDNRCYFILMNDTADRKNQDVLDRVVNSISIF